MRSPSSRTRSVPARRHPLAVGRYPHPGVAPLELEAGQESLKLFARVPIAGIEQAPEPDQDVEVLVDAAVDCLGRPPCFLLELSKVLAADLLFGKAPSEKGDRQSQDKHEKCHPILAEPFCDG